VHQTLDPAATAPKNTQDLKVSPSLARARRSKPTEVQAPRLQINAARPTKKI
jgi:hypothetical protein